MRAREVADLIDQLIRWYGDCEVRLIVNREEEWIPDKIVWDCYEVNDPGFIEIHSSTPGE